MPIRESADILYRFAQLPEVITVIVILGRAGVNVEASGFGLRISDTEHKGYGCRYRLPITSCQSGQSVSVTIRS